METQTNSIRFLLDTEPLFISGRLEVKLKLIRSGFYWLLYRSTFLDAWNGNPNQFYPFLLVTEPLYISGRLEVKLKLIRSSFYWLLYRSTFLDAWNGNPNQFYPFFTGY